MLGNTNTVCAWDCSQHNHILSNLGYFGRVREFPFCCYISVIHISTVSLELKRFQQIMRFVCNIKKAQRVKWRYMIFIEYLKTMIFSQTVFFHISINLLYSISLSSCAYKFQPRKKRYCNGKYNLSRNVKDPIICIPQFQLKQDFSKNGQYLGRGRNWL